MKKSSSHKIFIIIVCAILGSVTGTLQAQRTTRKGLHTVTENNISGIMQPDTIIPDNGSFRISVAGYDKPLRSSKETFFISNHTTMDLSGIRIRLEYFDTHGRTLHQRELYLPIDLPSGATRQTSIRSWDIQKSFYYRLSSRPRRSDGTEYDVRVTVISAAIKN